MSHTDDIPVFPPDDHDHEACVADALASAEVLCQERGLRLTAQRRRVLELVWMSHRPVGAYDILESLGEDGRKPAPPTVYRALDFLMDAGLVHRLDSLNAYVGCRDPAHPHAGQFLICRECRSVAEMDDRELQHMVNAKVAEAGFRAESQMLEIQGLCRRCQRRAGTAGER